MTNTEIETFGFHILCIDDSRSQLEIYRSQLEGQYTVTTALNYEESIACLTTTKPDLIILDMNMPQVTGLEFLDILRFTPSYAAIPVIIVSGDEDIEHVKEALRKNAADYIHKPYDEEELRLRIQRIFRFAIHLKNEISEGKKTQGSAKEMMIKSLADLSATRDNETGQHLLRVEKYVCTLASAAAKTIKFMSQINVEFIAEVSGLSKLHDIGKVSVPDHILHKPGPLTEREFEVMKRHTIDGAQTISKISLSFPECNFLNTARDIIMYHHEHWDGSGYPEGLKGEAIPLSARIVAFADVLDAITMKRVYKPAMSFEDAVGLIDNARGTQFDPDLLDVFLKCEGENRKIYEQYR